jgi:DNA repair protein RecO (recombination protein O)
MRSRNYKSEGIVLKRINMGEADRILTIFTKKHGKIHCVAKGVRKPTSRKSGHIELFDNTLLYLAKGKNIDILTQAEVIKRFSQIRTKLKAAKAAFHVVEIIDQLLPENQNNHNVYKELLNILAIIDSQGQATKRQIAEFEERILILLGFGSPKENSYVELKKHIESIIEKRLQSEKIFKDI